MQARGREAFRPRVSYEAMLQQRALVSAILRRFNEDTGLKLEDERGQATFVEALREALSYPPSTKWLASLLKEVVKAIEDRGGECSDELMELVVDTASKRASLSDTDVEAYYSIYDICGKTIACRAMRLHNDVGTKIWGAGLFLSSLCINRPDIFARRRVVELGCGIGLTGLCLAAAAAATAPPESVVLTDYTLDTMNNLDHNIELNRSIISSDCALSTLRLDWTLYKDPDSQYYRDITQQLGSVDIILAADCTYSPDICIDLTKTIKLMLQTSKGSRKEMGRHSLDDEDAPACLRAPPYAIVASTLRNEDTFQCFLAALEESCMLIDDITEWTAPTASQRSVFYQSDVSVEVIKVFCLRVQ